jgi:hypothetical protein
VIGNCEHMECGICETCALAAANEPLPLPKRLQLSRQKGYDLRAYSLALNGLPVVNCARPGPWGNPYRVVKEGSDFVDEREWRVVDSIDEVEIASFALEERAVRCAVDMFANLIMESGHNSGLKFDAEVIRRELRGRNLACWCALSKAGAADVCHAAILLKVANERTEA